MPPPVAWRDALHDLEKDILQVCAADLEVLGRDAGLAQRRQQRFDLVRIVRGQLHDAAGHARLLAQ